MPAGADGGCIPARDGRLVCPQPDSACMSDPDGNVLCSTPGGGIEFDRYGKPACGPGYCTKDQRGDIFCSSAPRGAAATDQNGNAVCAGSCVRAKIEACVRPKPSN
jgi:hypothetical protein